MAIKVAAGAATTNWMSAVPSKYNPPVAEGRVIVLLSPEIPKKSAVIKFTNSTKYPTAAPAMIIDISRSVMT
jgi:hypothetical protein